MVARTIVYSILIVCDDCETGQIWSYALRQRGIKTCVMAVIQDALCALNENSYDLVLVDICNPQLSGLNLCQQLRKELIIPILLLDNHQPYWPIVALQYCRY